MASKRVAVIGAGASGLAAIKCCLEEGLEPVCFERTDSMGGLWHYTAKAVDNQGCVMKSTVINTSKEMMCYSDFPIPQEFPNYMHNTKVLEYLKLYAENFELTKRIRFKTQILRVKKAADFAASGRWEVDVKDLATSAVTVETYDSVFICTGHHAEKHVPSFPGLSDFKGEVIHTHDYRDHVGYEDKRILVIGIGNSGGDVAVELGRVAKQVYLSTRRGTWVLKRIGDQGLPVDMQKSQRLLWAIMGHLPLSFINMVIEADVTSTFDHTLYGLRPTHGILSAHPMVNDDLPNRIICGAVKVKANVSSVSATAVQFEDGTVEEDIDTIILATGYKFGFPFIDRDVIDVQENRVDLYKYIFPPDLEHPTLAIIGCIQPWGAIMPISEMQCRWATRLWKGEVELPSKEAMWEEIRKNHAAMSARYVKSQRHTIQVDYLPYMDELADEVGCRPNIRRLLMSDPVLGWRCLTDSCTPYQYRLHGPHPWSGARTALLTQWNRVFHVLKTRQAEPPTRASLMWKAVFFLVLALIVSYLFF